MATGQDAKAGRGKKRGRADLARAVETVESALSDPALPATLALARGGRGQRAAAALSSPAVGRLILASAELGRARDAGAAKRRRAATCETPLARLSGLAERVRACPEARSSVKGLMRDLSSRESGYNAADISTVAFEVTGERRRTKREALEAIEAWLAARTRK